MMNKCILIGRLGKDAEVRGSQDKPIIAFSLAVSTPMAGGERDTQWFSCSAFGSTAKFLGGVMPKKGQLVLVEGKMKSREYTDKNGIKHTSMDIVVDNFQFLERKADSERDRAASIGGGGGSSWNEGSGSPSGGGLWR